MRFDGVRHRWLSVACCAFPFALSAVAGGAVDAPQSARYGSRERPFELTDQSGRMKSEKDFIGTWLLIYFGFTSCPDVCPTSVAELAQAIRLLGPDAAQLRAVFITIDPERDTPAVLSHYLAGFHAPITGLTGTKPQIARVLTTFDAYAGARPNAGGDGYTMEHSSAFYLIDPRGRFERRISTETSAPVLADSLRKIVTARR